MWKTSSPLAQEEARPGHLARLALVGAEVVDGRLDRRVHRDVEVVVEVGAVGRVPGERPALLGLVALDLLDRRARDLDERGVAGVQVLEQARGHLVRAGRAARAAVLPLRVEHEVAEDQLQPALEQVEQARLAVGAGEDVVLLDLDHRHLPALGVERVALPRQLLLLGQQRRARGQPLVSGHDVRKAHGTPLYWGHMMRHARGSELIGPLSRPSWRSCRSRRP